MRALVTCPVCGTDQHIYRKALANHDMGLVRCTGSKTPLNEVVYPKAKVNHEIVSTPTTSFEVVVEVYDMPSWLSSTGKSYRAFRDGSPLHIGAETREKLVERVLEMYPLCTFKDDK